MEQKLNIAEILKDKPQGTKLYNLLYNIDVELDEVVTIGTKKIVWCTDKIGNNDVCHRFYSEFGTIEGYPDGLQILLPSKKMRDWNKFAWKKGDVLTNSSGFQIFFDKWVNEDYTEFLGKIKLLGNSHCYDAAYYTLASEEEALEFIKSVEEINNGKLNRETLEIEKQTEFKDGDIIKMTWDKYSAIAIFWKYNNFGKGFDSHVFFNIKTKIIEYNIHGHTIQDMILRLATEEEKKQLFSALANKGKAWDAYKKKVVNLKPKFDELKPFDKVVVRCSEADRWSIDFFSHKVHNGYICTGDAWFGYCLPYNDETSHLLGTTDDWEGDEQ